MHKTFNERSQREDTSLYIISISYALIGVPSHSFAEKNWVQGMHLVIKI